MTDEAKKIETDEDLSGDVAVFIDRDGTINKAGAGEYITSWQNFEFIPGAIEAFEKLAQLPVKIFIVTNQSAVHRDMITEGDLKLIHGMMEFEIVSAGGRIDSIKFCPHIPKDKCGCRKPNTLLFTELAREHAIDLSKSFNIGDHIRDMKAGSDLGLTNILVRTGHGQMAETQLASQDIKVHHIAENLLEASQFVADNLRV